MSEMADRVADAIREKYEAGENWEEMAHAAIAAMREPTKEMADKGGDVLDDCKDGGWDSGGDGESHNTYEYIMAGSQTTIYQAMIDAALKPDHSR